MSDGGDLGLGNEDFFGDDDGGDLNRIFDDDDDDGQADPLDKPEPKKPEPEIEDNHSQTSEINVDPEDALSAGEPNEDDDISKDLAKEIKKEEKEGDEDDEGKPKKKKRRRASAASAEGDRSGPPPAWHSEAADKPHREAMIKEM